MFTKADLWDDKHTAISQLIKRKYMQNINEKYSALYMQQYRINAAILFKHSEMDKII